MDRFFKIAYICMEGISVHWYRWIHIKIPDMDWDRFMEELSKCYSGRKAANPFESQASLRQDQGSVEEYISHFEVLMAQIGELPENQAMGCLLSGLQEEIRKRIRIHELKTIIWAMKLARDVAELVFGNPNVSGSNYSVMGPIVHHWQGPGLDGRRVAIGFWSRKNNAMSEPQERRVSQVNLSAVSK